MKCSDCQKEKNVAKRRELEVGKNCTSSKPKRKGRKREMNNGLSPRLRRKREGELPVDDITFEMGDESNLYLRRS